MGGVGEDQGPHLSPALTRNISITTNLVTQLPTLTLTPASHSPYSSLTHSLTGAALSTTSTISLPTHPTTLIMTY